MGLPKPSKLPSRGLLESIWSLSANPDTTDMEDTDMEDTDTTTAKRLSSPSPNKSVSNLSTDTPMSPHQHPVTQLPLPLMLKQSTLKIALPPNDQVILCRSIVPHKECFQDNNYLSIFIITLL